MSDMVKEKKKLLKIFLVVLTIIAITIFSSIQIIVYTFPEDYLNPAHFRYKAYYYNEIPSAIYGYQNVSTCYMNELPDDEGPGLMLLNYSVGMWYIPRCYTAPLIVAWIPGLWQFHTEIITLYENFTVVIRR